MLSLQLVDRDRTERGYPRTCFAVVVLAVVLALGRERAAQGTRTRGTQRLDANAPSGATHIRGPTLREETRICGQAAARVVFAPARQRGFESKRVVNAARGVREVLRQKYERNTKL
jgi:hypothetical protein